jgi:hypothetical protein
MRIAPPSAAFVLALAAAMGLAVGTARADAPPLVPPGGAPPAIEPPPTTVPPTPATPSAPPVEALPPTAPATSGMPPAPTLAPEPGAGAAPLTLEQPGQVAATAPPAPAKPFYRKVWFWAAVGVVVATVTIVLIATANGGPDTPTTNLGDHHAF